MSRFKVLKTEHEETFGILETITNGYGQSCVMVCTSSKPQLLGIECDEKFLAEYFSKYRIYRDEHDDDQEERNFDWEKDIPKEWKLVEAEVRLIEEPGDIDLTKIVSSEEWEELNESQSAIVRSIIEIEEIKPFENHSSLHIWEQRYKIDDDTIRLIGAIGSEDSSVERLKK